MAIFFSGFRAAWPTFAIGASEKWRKDYLEGKDVHEVFLKLEGYQPISHCLRCGPRTHFPPVFGPMTAQNLTATAANSEPLSRRLFSGLVHSPL